LQASQVKAVRTTQLTSENNTNNNTTNITAINVAFVSPTFTYAAYQRNGFYDFYDKSIDMHEVGTNVTKNLNLLTVKVLHGPFFEYANDSPSATPPPPREQEYSELLTQHLGNRTILNNNHINSVKITNITDEDVNDGLIFSNNSGSLRSNNSSNGYDVLFLFHLEYATQAEYNKLKKFVANGGTIVFNDAHILTTEVEYNSTNDSITFVRGHGWQYDEKSEAVWPAEKEMDQ
jgi:hypothetical protein